MSIADTVVSGKQCSTLASVSMTDTIAITGQLFHTLIGVNVIGGPI